MTTIKLKSVDNPQTDEPIVDNSALVKEYIEKLEHVTKEGNMYKFIPNEINTNKNECVSLEYVKVFKKQFKDYNKFYRIKDMKNPTRSLLLIMSKLVGFETGFLLKDEKRYTCVFVV